MDSGLWTKAFADSRGRNEEAKALYLKMRVLDLKQRPVPKVLSCEVAEEVVNVALLTESKL